MHNYCINYSIDDNVVMPELSQKARAPLRLSMEGVGELMAPEFCLTMATTGQTGHQVVI